MQQTLFAILTSEQARSNEAIEANLDHEFIVGAPWFSKEQSLSEEYRDIQQPLEQ